MTLLMPGDPAPAGETQTPVATITPEDLHALASRGESVNVDGRPESAIDLWNRVGRYAEHCIANNAGKEDPEALAALPAAIRVTAQQELLRSTVQTKTLDQVRAEMDQE